MPAITTNRLKTSIAKKYIESLNQDTNNLYFFMGKPINEDIFVGGNKNYIMEYYPYDYVNIKSEISNPIDYNKITRVEHPTDVTQFQADVSPQLSCYGHLYITNIIQGNFPNSDQPLKLIFGENALNNDIILDNAIKFKRAYPISNKSGININTPTDNEFENNIAFNEMIAMRKVRSEDTRLSIKRVNWVNGNKYYPWSGTAGYKYIGSNGTELTTKVIGHSTATSLDEVEYYAMTDAFEIFMCIRAPSGNSTDKPSRTDTNKYDNDTLLFTGNDGYIWRYMFRIEEDGPNLLTSNYIPIPTDTSRFEDTPYKKPVMAYNPSGDFTVNRSGTSYTIAFDPSSEEQKIVKLKLLADINNNVTNDDITVEEVEGEDFNFLSTIHTHYGFRDSNGLSSNNNNTIIPLYGQTDSIPDLEVVVPPIGGYGSDIAAQLRANIIQITLFLDHNQTDIPITNFSQVGLIENVKLSNGTLATEDTLSVASGVSITPTSSNYKIGLKNIQSTIVQLVSSLNINININGLSIEKRFVENILKYIQPYRYTTERGDNDETTGIGFASYPRVLKFGKDIDNTRQTNTILSYARELSASVLNSINGVFAGILFDNTPYANGEIMPYSGNIIYISERELIRRQDQRTEKITLAIEV